MVVIGVPVEATPDGSDTPAIAYTSCPAEYGGGTPRKPVIVIESEIESGLCEHQKELSGRAGLSGRIKLGVNKAS